MSKIDTVTTDVLIIGGGPSGLATAIHLADLFKKKSLDRKILLVEKGSAIGSHILSGAVIKTNVLEELLPEVPLSDFPLDAKVTTDATLLFTKGGNIKSPVHVPYMSNKGNYSTSLGQLCRFLAKKAEEKGVEIYPGFAVSDLLYSPTGKVIGAKTIDTGIDHHGTPMENFQSGTSIEAKLTVFAEGTRGSLAKKLIAKYQLDAGKNPQMYSLGCKELWSVPEGNIKPGEVYHTMGYPLNMKEFGGGFIYGLNDNKVAIGMVVGLDTSDPTFDFHALFQVWKQHPMVASILKGGKLLEYGAKTLPEGGYYSLIKPYIDNALLVGDSVGFLAMPALKGVHLAIQSGILAAQTAVAAFEKNDFSEDTLKLYQQKIDQSLIYKELYKVRNFRQAFAKGMISGGVLFGSQLISGGAGISGRLKAHNDAEVTQKLRDFNGILFHERFKGRLEFDRITTFDKVTDVYYSGATHDEEQLCHLHVNNPATFVSINIEEYGAPCQYFCPADVYEIHTNKEGQKELRIHGENCVHCKTCDIKSVGDGITWNVPNGGNGPEYQNM